MDHFQRLYDTTVRTLDGLSGNGYGKEQDDRLRQEGTIATLNGEEVKWNKGDWVPTNEYKKPKKFERAADNVTDTIEYALNGDLGYRHLNTVRNEAVKMSAGAAHYVSTNVVEPLKTVSEDYGNGHYEPNGAGENLAVGIGSGLRLAEWGLDKAGDAGEYLGNHLDIDPRVSRFVAEEALTALATAGSSTVLKQGLKVANKLDNLIPPRTPQLAIAKGGAHVQIPTATPDLSQQVFDITIKNPEFIAPGVREGIAKDPDVARQIVDRSDKVEKQANRLETWRQAELKATTLKEKAVAKKNQKKATADLRSQMSNVPQIVQDDPIAYRVKQFKDVDKIEQHHLISKAQTAGYYDQMDYLIERNLADHDDLVAMGEYAKMRGAASGDRLSNMLNMNKIPHNEYHTYLRDTGQEIKPKKIREIVRKAKNADELMELYKDFIDNQISVKQDAIGYQNLWDMDK